MLDIEKYADTTPQYYDQKIPKLMLKYLKKSKYKSLLDSGCGDGALLHTLMEEGFLDKKTVYAIDLSQKRVNLVKKINPKFKAYKDDVEKLKNIPSNSIDFYISTQVIEHVDDKKMISAIDRVTRKGATIYINTVFKKKWAWYFYRNNGKWVLDPTHLREYQKDNELLDLFDKKKFKLLESQKELDWLSLGGFLLPRIGAKKREIGDNPLAKLSKKIKVPIPGYYIWDLVLQKR